LLYRDQSEPITLEEAGGSLMIPTPALMCVRGIFALVHLGIIGYMLRMPPTQFTLSYKAELGTHLKTETFEIVGLQRMYTFFTIWTYAAQMIYFALAALSSAALVFDREDLVTARMLYAAHLLFETGAGCGFVVTVVVTFVIWPEKVRDGEPHDLHEPWNIMMHNVNTLENVTELLFGRVPITVSHAPVGVVWGTSFIIFSWIHAPALARQAHKKGGKSEGNGGNFPYFFLDWTLPLKVQFTCYIGLLSTLLVFYFGAMGLSALVLRSSEYTGMLGWLRVSLAYVATSFLLKWRD